MRPPVRASVGVRPAHQHWLLVAAAACVVALLAAAAYFAVSSHLSARAEFLDATRTEAMRQAQTFATLVDQRVRLLTGIAASPAAVNGEEGRLLGYLQRLQSDPELRFSGGIGWVGRDGMTRVRTGVPREAPRLDLSDRVHVQEVLRTGRPYVSDVVLGRDLRVPVVVVAVPTRDARGRLSGVLAGGLRLDRGVSRGQIEEAGLERTFVVDRAGNLVFAAGRALRTVEPVAGLGLVTASRAADDGVLLDVDGPDGAEGRLVGYARVPSAGWSVFVDRSYAATVGASERRLAAELVGIVVVGGIGLLFALVLSRRMSRSERDEERSARRWQAATLSFASAVTEEDTRQAVFDNLCAPLAADAVVFAVQEGDDIVAHLAHAGGVDVPRRVPVSSRVALAEALLAGSPVVVRNAEELNARFPDMSLLYDDRHIESLVDVPMRTVGGATLGAIGVHYARAVDLQPAQLAYLQSLAAQCAQALERAQLLSRELRSRRRAERAQELATELASASSRRAATLTLLHGIRHVFESDGASVALMDGDAQSAEALIVSGASGRPRTLRLERGEQRIALAALGATPLVAVRSRRELRQRFPDTEDEEFESFASAALDAGDGPFGTVTVAWRDARAFEPEELLSLRTLATQSAQALERARMMGAERAQRRLAERSRHRAAVLARIGAELETTLSSRARMLRLVDVLVPEVADFATVELPGTNGRPLLVVARHRDPGELEVLHTLRREHALGPGSAISMRRVMESETPVLIEHVSTGDVERATDDEEARMLLRRLRPRSVLMVPITARNTVLGALMMGTARSGRRFRPEDVDFGREIGQRAGLAIENARLYEREHEVALELQHSLLAGRLAEAEHVELSVAYQAGQDDLDVGGDWYDALELEGGRIGYVVGDVVGRGVRAAAAMGQLRSSLASIAAVTPHPGESLGLLARIAGRIEGADLATVLYAVLDPRTGELVYTSAGHPPPLVVPQRGEATFLWGARTTPLGALDPMAPAPEAMTTLAAGDTVLLYTDGLVERRGEGLDTGLERLKEAASARRRLGVGALSTELLDAMRGDPNRLDDVALLVLRVTALAPDRLRLRVPAGREELAGVRREVRDWLGGVGASDDEIAELVLALGEACANVVEHAFAGSQQGASRLLEVDGRVDGGEVVVIVRDNGCWDDTPPSPDRGRGLKIMESLATRIDIVRRPEGTAVTLRHRVASAGG